MALSSTRIVQAYHPTITARKFHLDPNRIKGLFGAVGCGKSVACMMHIMMSAMAQSKGNDGVRRSRWAIVRNTYPDLKSTTIKTWQAWFPAEKFGAVKYDSPIVHHIKVGDVDLEVLFLSLDTPSDVRKLKSLELTGIYFNELQFIDQLMFDVGKQRTNRYPSKKDGAAPTWTGVIFDANPPSTLHWMYDIFEKNRPDSYSIYKYPAALLKVNEVPIGIDHAISREGSIYINNMAADYRVIQSDPNYWLELVKGARDEHIKVDLMGQYGVIISGRPVHPSYNDTLHFSNKKLEYNPLLEIGLGFDFGLTPACAIVQLNTRGKLQMLDEVYAIHMGLRDFLINILVPHLDLNYEGWRLNYYSSHDPAGGQGAQTDGKSCEDILHECGIKSFKAADNNSPTLRRDSLDFFLGRMVDGEPAFCVSNKVQLAREGLMGHYQYDRIQAGGEARFHDKPLKNIYSHICEGLEYIAIRYAGLIKKPVREPKPSRMTKKPFFSR